MIDHDEVGVASTSGSANSMTTVTNPDGVGVASTSVSANSFTTDGVGVASTNGPANSMATVTNHDGVGLPLTIGVANSVAGYTALNNNGLQLDHVRPKCSSNAEVCNSKSNP